MTTAKKQKAKLVYAAVLIASAPELLRQRDELLAACKAALAWMELPGNGQYDVSEKVRAAIAACEKGAQ